MAGGCAASGDGTLTTDDVPLTPGDGAGDAGSPNDTGAMDVSRPTFDIVTADGPATNPVDGPARDGVGPDASSVEVCGNGLDDDRDGRVDEGCACVPGATQRCFNGPSANAGVGACTFGMTRCEGTGEFGMWGACVGARLPSGEACDSVDNNCDGRVDDGCVCRPGESRACYTGPMGTRGIGACRAGTQMCTAGASGFGSVWAICTGEVRPVTEACDGVDNDCDGTVDNGCTCTPGATRTCYGGPTGTAGVGPCRQGRQSCASRGGAVSWGTCEMQVIPAPELCDGVDNDCDGTVDNGCECRPGATRACYDGPMSTRGVGLCADGTQTCVAGMGGVGSSWGTCSGARLPGAESCDERDNNCNGAVDEGCVCRRGETRACYTGPTGTQGVGLCRAGTQPCVIASGVASWGACAGEARPGAETCDGIDNDCDGMVDNGCACLPGAIRSCYTGPAGTAGSGICRPGMQTCVAGTGGVGSAWGTCTGQTTPGMETCDTIDNDCDGTVDNGCVCAQGQTRTCYGGPAGTSGTGICRSGTQSCVIAAGVASWGACTGEARPATETCDGADNDCDGTVDEGCTCTPGSTQSCYTGPAGTAGVGICRRGRQTCRVSGLDWGVCSGEVRPAMEACDGIDNDCDGTVDNGCACTPGATRACYGGPMNTQGVGVCRAGMQTCVAGTGGVGSAWGACTGETRPGTETCDARDNDCNGTVDDGCACTPGATRACYTGPMGTQAVGICRPGMQTCVAGTGGVGSAWGTCTGQTLPTAETCNRMDDNCNGMADEGLGCNGPTAVCPANLTVPAGTTVTLNGMSMFGSSYRWEVVSAPTGGAATLGAPTAQSTTFTSVIVGTFTVRFTVTDAMGRTASCMTQITNQGHGLRVEMVWDTDRTDIDLHVHNRLAPSWFDTTRDCYFAFRTQEWDTAATNDNPSLDTDDRDGRGPENIRVDSPPTSQVYTVGVHYWTGSPATSVTVRIYCGELLAAPAFTRSLRSASTLADDPNNDFWRVARVQFSSPSACTVTPINDVITGSRAHTGSP